MMPSGDVLASTRERWKPTSGFPSKRSVFRVLGSNLAIPMGMDVREQFLRSIVVKDVKDSHGTRDATSSVKSLRFKKSEKDEREV